MPPQKVDNETLDRLAENERHFHNIQAGTRGLASTWMLAAFTGIAFLLQQNENVKWRFPPFALVIIICLMENVGLSALWIIDQLVYQRLFNTNYLAGLRLEQQFPFIPPVRAIQAFTVHKKSIAFWIRFFYVGPMVAFATAAFVAAVIQSISADSSPKFIQLMVIMLGLVPFAPLAWFLYKAREVPFFRLATLLPNDYSMILEEDNCRAIIERHVAFLNAANPDAKIEISSEGPKN